MVKLQIFTVFCLITILEAAKLPSYLTQCKRKDPNINECIKKNGNEAIPYVAKGDIHYDIPSVLPLSFPGPIVSKENNNSELVVTDLQIHGLESTIISNAELELEKGTFKMTMNIPTITALASCHSIGNYSGYHELLNEKLIGTSINHNTNFTLMEIDGEVYFTKLVHSEKLQSQEQFNEIFRGSGPLKVHKTVCQERIPQIIERQIGEYLFTIFMTFARRVPLDGIFIP